MPPSSSKPQRYRAAPPDPHTMSEADKAAARSRKRTIALRDEPRDEVNVARKLRRRELCRRGNFAFNRNRAAEKFRNFKLLGELDAYKGEVKHLKLHFLRKRTKIVEIVAAGEVLFGLTHTGVCAAFNRVTQRRICFLNVTPDEVIRSLFYNKTNQSLITVSVYRYDNFSSLRCRSTPVEYILRNKPGAGFELFTTESLRWPGFVEFDDVNSKVLTYSAANKVYKVWDLVNYGLLYALSDENITEIKISPGIMLLIFAHKKNDEGAEDGAAETEAVPLKILNIEDGRVMKAFEHPLIPGQKVDFIEQFNEKLLVKQEHQNLQIVDVRSADTQEVNKHTFETPSAFIFLYENQLFLTFRGRTVQVWNFRGQLVTRFKDHTLWHPDCNTNNIYITSQQDLIISYCKSRIPGTGPGLSGAGPPTRYQGSINVSSILTGQCLAKVLDKTPPLPRAERKKKKKKKNALEDVTALFYNEERNEIYTGNKSGLIHIWGN